VNLKVPALPSASFSLAKIKGVVSPGETTPLILAKIGDCQNQGNTLDDCQNQGNTLDHPAVIVRTKEIPWMIVRTKEIPWITPLSISLRKI
jgi:hypothetical protein